MMIPYASDAPSGCTDSGIGRYAELYIEKRLREPRLTDFTEHAVTCAACSELIRDLKARGLLR